MQSLGIVFGKWILFLPLFRPQSSLFNVNNSGLNEVFKWQKRILIYWLKLAWGRLAGQGRANKQMRLLGHWRLWRATVEETFISTPHLSYCQGSLETTIFSVCDSVAGHWAVLPWHRSACLPMCLSADAFEKLSPDLTLWTHGHIFLPPKSQTSGSLKAHGLCLT